MNAWNSTKSIERRGDRFIERICTESQYGSAFAFELPQDLYGNSFELASVSDFGELGSGSQSYSLSHALFRLPDEWRSHQILLPNTRRFEQGLKRIQLSKLYLCNRIRHSV